MGPSLGGYLLETFDFPVSSTVMAVLSFALAIFVLFYFLTIKQPYDSQIYSSGKDGKDRNTETSDSGISDNGNGVTSRSSSTTLEDESVVSNNVAVVIDETTPLLMSRSLDREDSISAFGFGAASSSGINITDSTGDNKPEIQFSPSFGSFPQILKTVSITGTGAVEV